MHPCRLLVSIEGGPHPGASSIATDVSSALAGALAFDPSVSELDKIGDSPLALALARIQSNCASLRRCPCLASTQLLICTKGFFDDCLFITDERDATMVSKLYRSYGQLCGITAHICLVLNSPISEMHHWAIDSGDWPKCTIADLSCLPERLVKASSRFSLTPSTFVRTMNVPPHFHECEIDRANTLGAIINAIKMLMHHAGPVVSNEPEPIPNSANPYDMLQDW